MAVDFRTEREQFLSTPSARRATVSVPVRYISFLNFYPRPPRGGRPYNGSMFTKSFEISIHALREEGDLMMLFGSVRAILFLSTPSARRATTTKISDKTVQIPISIHALREEGDTLF